MALATFVHVSDFHFGELQEDQASAKVEDHWKWCSLYDGFLGHHHPPLKGLDKVYETWEEPYLLFTGDLTSWGKPEQFDRGSEFLEGETDFGGRCRPIGLEVDDWSDRAIAGNHDHWPGTKSSTFLPRPNPDIRGVACSKLDSCIGIHPKMRRISLPGDAPAIRLMMIDSSADVSENGLQRLLACGSFVSQIRDLEGQLDRIENDVEDEVRVLLMHHSLNHSESFRIYEYESVLQSCGIQGIDGQSKEVLADFLIEYDIAVLLTGHMHVPHVNVHQVEHSDSGESKGVLEARCGKTGVTTDLPDDWHNSVLVSERRIDRGHNSLLLHRVEEQEEGLLWSTETHFLNPGGSFIPYYRTEAHSTGELSELQLEDRVSLR